MEQRRTWHSHKEEKRIAARKLRLGQDRRYSVFVGACALLTFVAVLGPSRMPAAVQGLVGAYRNAGRENAPPEDAYYSGCNEARTAGVAPLHAGEPGYREEMDGDGDGVACEPYRG